MKPTHFFSISILTPLCLTLFSCSCGTRYLDALQHLSSEPKKASVHSNGPVSQSQFQHVVVLAIDGLRADQFHEFINTSRTSKLPEILGARRNAEGQVRFSHTLMAEKGTTVFPSYTFPAWTSFVTGVYPGAHGITGNQLLFRNEHGYSTKNAATRYIPEARYYTEPHLDSIWTYWSGLLNEDISPIVPTIYEIVKEAGGQSLIVHHMISRGVFEKQGDWRWPTKKTLELYLNHDSMAYDSRTLSEYILAVKDLNGGKIPDVKDDLFLPTLTTLYFPGLDHQTHVSASRNIDQTEYLDRLDATFNCLFLGCNFDNQWWPGLYNYEKVRAKILFVIVSDHGHSHIFYNKAISNQYLEGLLSQLILETKLNVHRTRMSLLGRTKHQIEYDGDPQSDETAFVTINGGSASIYLKVPGKPSWNEMPTSSTILGIARALYDAIRNHDLPITAMFIRSGNSYQECSYLQLNSLSKTHEVFSCDRLSDTKLYGPDWQSRLSGLAPVPLQDAVISSPDIILLVDRGKGVTFTNDQLPLTIATEGPDNRLLKSDHGHLNESDSLIPIVFFSKAFDLTTDRSLPAMSIVDISPTILEALGLHEKFVSKLSRFPNSHVGKSYYSHLATALSDSQGVLVSSGISKISDRPATEPYPGYRRFASQKMKSLYKVKLDVELRPVFSTTETKQFDSNFVETNSSCDGVREISQRHTFNEPGWEMKSFNVKPISTSPGGDVQVTKADVKNTVMIQGQISEAKCGWFTKKQPGVLGYTLQFVGERSTEQSLDVFRAQVEADIDSEKGGEISFTYPFKIPANAELKWYFRASVDLASDGKRQSYELTNEKLSVEGITMSMENKKLIVSIAPAERAGF